MCQLPHHAAPARFLKAIVLLALVALASALVTGLLVNIYERKAEARRGPVRRVAVGEDDTDPAHWGINWPRQYDSYKRTAEATRTRFGGHGGSEALPAQKIERDPWLRRMFLGYAFSIDYFPWGNGLKVEEMEAFWDAMTLDDGSEFYDYVHQETGAKVLKAQHPEFELWSQGIHARSGVSCADCHMPYMRDGAAKISDHWVRSPLLNINRACEVCHSFSEAELAARADAIQQRNFGLLQRAGAALMDQLDAIAAARAAGAEDEDLAAALALQRKAQWRLDFVAAENSMGFHAPQEAARILGEAADYARQGQIAAIEWLVEAQKPTLKDKP